ncbi:MAG TPA: hypothetical protein VK737_11600 [Opitutales bacterium]|jgi:hypothetical protein|nr:hypothetical protein [Opitutales bacterium]
MKTNVTLNNDVMKPLRDAPHKQILTTYNMGANPDIDFNKANALAAELEDEEIMRKLALGK